MLKRTSASIGLIIAAAVGASLAGTPAYARTNMAQGWHSSHHHYSHHRNHNWNGNRHHGRIFIRIYIYNKNNNHAVAVARPERRETRPSWLGDDDPFLGVPGQGPTSGQGVTSGQSRPYVTVPLG